MTPDAVAAAICTQAGYTPVGLVGSGAFKFTYHVRDHTQSLALKLYQKGMSERALREIEAMMKCTHPSIAKFIHFDWITLAGDRYPYLIEEYLSGGSLSNRIGKTPPKEIAKIALRLSEAIDHIASHNLVHRDLKPDNVMFRDASNDSPVVVDFGLVRDLNAASLTATHAMQGPGTAFFSAPEQLNNEKGMITFRTDQFGLGATLANVLFDSHPYARSGDRSPTDAIQRVANWEDIPSEFVDACKKASVEPLVQMVRPYPVERFRTGPDLIAAWRSKVMP